MRDRKGRKQEEEKMDDSWLLPYADLLTLLLALFIVLFSISSIDVIKFQHIAKSFQSSFYGGTGVLQYPNPVPRNDPEHSLNPEDLEDLDDEQFEDIRSQLPTLFQLQEKVDEYIVANDLEAEIETRLTKEGLMLTLQNDILFDSGSAVIKEQYRGVAREISQLLEMEIPREVVISGHTDNVPIHNHEFSNNWHLSVMRAVNFLHILLENENLDSDLFSIKGHGEYKPIASNETEEGRTLNRRVEILIRPSQSEEQNLIE